MATPRRDSIPAYGPGADTGKVKTTTRQQHTNDVPVGGAVSTRGGFRLDDPPVHSVTALRTVANNGAWSQRIMKKDRQDRRVTVSHRDPAALRAERGL